jgi:hypothetical protein
MNMEKLKTFFKNIVRAFFETISYH